MQGSNRNDGTNNGTYCKVNLKFITIFCTLTLTSLVILLSCYIQYVMDIYKYFRTDSSFMLVSKILQCYFNRIISPKNNLFK